VTVQVAIEPRISRAARVVTQRPCIWITVTFSLIVDVRLLVVEPPPAVAISVVFIRLTNSLVEVPIVCVTFLRAHATALRAHVVAQLPSQAPVSLSIEAMFFQIVSSSKLVRSSVPADVDESPVIDSDDMNSLILLASIGLIVSIGSGVVLAKNGVPAFHMRPEVNRVFWESVDKGRSQLFDRLLEHKPVKVLSAVCYHIVTVLLELEPDVVTDFA